MHHGTEEPYITSMHPLTAPEYITEDYEAQAIALALDFALSFPLSLRVCSSLTTTAAESSSLRPAQGPQNGPPQKVLLGDFSKLLYFVKKEFDGEGAAHSAELDLQLTITGIVAVNSNGKVICDIAFTDGSVEQVWDYIAVDAEIGKRIQYPIEKTIKSIIVRSESTNPALDYGILGTGCGESPSGINKEFSLGYSQKITLNQSALNLQDGVQCVNEGLFSFAAQAEEGRLAGLGLNYFGARYYDPEVGVWSSLDPKLEYWNGYSYVGSQPTSFVDPNGQTSKNWKRFWRTVGVFAADIASGGLVSAVATNYAGIVAGSAGFLLPGALANAAFGNGFDDYFDQVENIALQLLGKDDTEDGGGSDNSGSQTNNNNEPAYNQKGGSLTGGSNTGNLPSGPSEALARLEAYIKYSTAKGYSDDCMAQANFVAFGEVENWDGQPRYDPGYSTRTGKYNVSSRIWPGGEKFGWSGTEAAIGQSAAFIDISDFRTLFKFHNQRLKSD